MIPFSEKVENHCFITSVENLVHIRAAGFRAKSGQKCFNLKNTALSNKKLLLCYTYLSLDLDCKLYKI